VVRTFGVNRGLSGAFNALALACWCDHPKRHARFASLSQDSSLKRKVRLEAGRPLLSIFVSWWTRRMNRAWGNDDAT